MRKNKQKASVVVLLFLVSLGCVIRMTWIATKGHPDVDINTQWGISATKFGLIESYDRQIEGAIMKPNYPPLSLLLFQGTTRLFEIINGTYVERDYASLRTTMKIPANLADALIALMIFVMLSRWKSKTQGMLGAAAYWINPAVMYDSAFWGQTDAWFTLCILCALCGLVRGRPIFAGTAVTCSLLLKPQAVVAIPILIVISMKKKSDTIGLLSGMFMTLTAMAIPFLLKGRFDLFPGYYVDVTQKTSQISANAYNLWWFALGKDAFFSFDSKAVLWGWTAKNLGLAAFATLYAGIVLPLWLHLIFCRSVERRFTVACAALCAAYFAFFLLPTGIHERYLFPALPFLCILAFLNLKFLPVYAISSLGFWFNMSNIMDAWKADTHLLSLLPTLPLLIAYVHLLGLAFISSFIARTALNETQFGLSSHGFAMNEKRELDLHGVRTVTS